MIGEEFGEPDMCCGSMLVTHLSLYTTVFTTISSCLMRCYHSLSNVFRVECITVNVLVVGRSHITNHIVQ